MVGVTCSMGHVFEFSAPYEVSDERLARSRARRFVGQNVAPPSE
ncbi:hypothetical protein SAMN02745121_04838 [Nannocystis exedens]|uniref:Uncharacterized protein n=1 Tax=Nannocystis exedens TaxID=54 RepID=A0A1I2BZL2_9BACT|nr:hypothetical protein NAEX_04272 [Nannocystis exedens]SFE60750.1 hypothetical protein SAMN02745121_04838 [Nannocystis exedens]